jgi:hypothetical protein
VEEECQASSNHHKELSDCMVEECKPLTSQEHSTVFII